ncbi:unnamed protein product [Bursaphelenchus xylophilus]|uniref:(pine wood nematode) hypothetical protein n=1 Tax=Bursaphelenchus xylophilus TaxID=6326 RepID=A0A7I8XD44_BURXY|nr:unnamed protein product [Bursaphelenchus xylophilus]CAG9114054.1 unnamed protein product [Bursaphelenchus xylophilus]
MDKLPDLLTKMMETMKIQGESIKNLAATMESSMKLPSIDRTSALTHTMSLLGQFTYNPDQDYTFTEWFGQNEAILDDNCKDDAERKKIILKALGKDEYVQLKGRTSPKTPEAMDYQELLKILKEIFGSTMSLFRRRHETLSLTLPPGKTADEMLNEANIRGDKFEFTDLNINQFKIFLALQFIKDPSYKSIRSMILKAVDQKPDITIDELRKVLKSFETRMEDVNLGNSHDPSTSYEVNELQKYHRRPKYTPRGKTVHRNKNQTAKSAGDYTCYKCNGPHLATSCQKTNLCCAFCKKQGHNEAACLKKKARQFNNIVINNVGSGDSREYVTVGINAKVMEFRIDSGADMSIIGPEKWKALNRPPLTPFHITCSSVDGSPLTVKGSFKANLKYNGHSYTDTILVLAKKDTALLCGKASKELGVITFHNKEEANINIVDSYAQTMAVQYTDLFKEELGKCTKMQVHLQVKPNVNPVHKRARPVAIAVQDQVNTELDRLLDNGTLKKVDTSEWASPIVVAKKPGGKIRLCADYSTGLNDALADTTYLRGYK